MSVRSCLKCNHNIKAEKLMRCRASNSLPAAMCVTLVFLRITVAAAAHFSLVGGTRATEAFSMSNPNS